MSVTDKNKISHRYLALRQFQNYVHDNAADIFDKF
jgi:inosine/xanthosine triphosphate pyrophosphatase family protein